MIPKKVLDNNLREKYLKMITEKLQAEGEDVLQTGTNTIAFPCVDEENNDKFIEIVVKIPTGSRAGDIYDGYAEADNFKFLQEQKTIKEKKQQAQKAKKIERDKKQRAQKEAIKEKKEARKNNIN